MVRHTLPSRLSTQAVRAARTEQATATTTPLLSAHKLQRNSAQSAQSSTPNLAQSVEPARSFHTAPPSHIAASAAARITPTPRVSATVRSRLPDDEVTLRYYVERKAELDRAAERKILAGDLMPHLSATIISNGFNASITPRKHKVPLEFQDVDGTVLHPSGFVPPTPAQFHFGTGVVYNGPIGMNGQPDRVQDIDVPPNKAAFLGRASRGESEVKPAGAAMPTPPPEDKSASYARAFHSAAGDRASIVMNPPLPRASFRTSAVRKARQRQTDEEIALRFYVERKAEREQVAERKEVEGDLMPDLSATILSEGFGAAITAKEEKIPVEILAADGTVQHASGFVPPTPAEFHEALGVVSHGLQAHDPAPTPAGAKQLDASHSDAVPAESHSHRAEQPAGQTKPRAPPTDPSGVTASSFGARA